MSASVIEETVAKFEADRAAGIVQPVVTASLEDGTAVLSATSFTWHADLPPFLGGGNAAPSPVAYLLGALAGCAVAFIHNTLSPQLGVPIDNVSASVSSSFDFAGLVGIDGADPRLNDISIDIDIESPAPAEDIARLRQAWEDRCPVLLALLEPSAVSVNWT